MTIPITFTRNEKTYQGTLNQVAGGGSAMFHLMIDSFYQDCLIKTDNGWQFSTRKKVL